MSFIASMNIGRRGIHHLQTVNKVPKNLLKEGQDRVVEASLTLIREQAKLKVHHVYHAKIHKYLFIEWMLIKLAL